MAKVLITGGGSSSGSLATAVMLAAAMGGGDIFGNELKMLRPKKAKVFTEFDQKRIDAAKAKRERRNLKRLAR